MNVIGSHCIKHLHFHLNLPVSSILSDLLGKLEILRAGSLSNHFINSWGRNRDVHWSWGELANLPTYCLVRFDDTFIAVTRWTSVQPPSLVSSHNGLIATKSFFLAKSFAYHDAWYNTVFHMALYDANVYFDHDGQRCSKYKMISVSCLCLSILVHVLVRSPLFVWTLMTTGRPAHLAIWYLSPANAHTQPTFSFIVSICRPINFHEGI